MKTTSDVKKDEIVITLLELRISWKQAVAQLMDIGWKEDEANEYVENLLDG